jgi:hypothetical protein
MKIPILLLLSSFLLYSCTPAAPTEPPQLVTVYSSAAAEPWLRQLYECADGTPAALARVLEENSAQIALRVGEPEFLISPAFEVGTEQILIVTHRESPVQNLDLESARALFAGQGDPSAQVWVYAPGEDVQQVFDRAVMSGGRVSSSARMAANPQHMSEVLNAESIAVGILPRHWKMGNPREVYTVAHVPVLAITPTEPEAIVRELIGCMQSK